MKKLRRSARLVEMTQCLLARPHTLISLSAFSERYRSAKSSISEDLAIIREVFETEGIGELRTYSGAAGGVRFVPRMRPDRALERIVSICRELEDPDRLLPGGYLYMTDLLGQPSLLRDTGLMFASAFAGLEPDAIVTVETKGIPLACATAQFLNVPVVIARRDQKVTEGSTVSINYVSGSSKRIQTMSLARRALKEGSRVLIIDDFMKAGGTIRGMIDLLGEFRAVVGGVGVFVESGAVGAGERLLSDYVSLARLEEVDEKNRLVRVRPGNFFESPEFSRFRENDPQ